MGGSGSAPAPLRPLWRLFQKLIWALLPGGHGRPLLGAWGLQCGAFPGRFGVKSTLHSSAAPRLPPAWQQLPPEDVSTCAPLCASRPTSWGLFFTLLCFSVSEDGIA